MHLNLSFASMALLFLPYTTAQTPFPLAFSSATVAQIGSITLAVQVLATSFEAEPLYNSFINYVITAIALSPDEQQAFYDAGEDP